MMRRNERSTNFHEFLTLRRNRERREKFNRFNCNRFDLDRFNHFRRISKNQNRQSQNRDDDAKSIKMQRQKSLKRRNQREKRVKNSEEFVQLVRIKNVKRCVDQTLNHHSRQQSKRYELCSTIQNDNAKHSKNDHQRVDQR